MRRSNFFLAAWAAVAGLSLGVSQTRAGTPYPVVQLTGNEVHDANPDVSDGRVVWERWYGSDATKEVCLWDGNSTSTIANMAGLSGPPRISGSNIAWITGPGWSLGNQVALYDGQTISYFTAPDKTYGDRMPDVYGSNVVWENTGWIWLYQSGSITRISPGQSNKWPTISGSTAVWDHFDNGDSVQCYQGGQTATVCLGGAPAISGTTIAFQDTTLEPEIYLYSGGITTQITNNTLRDRQVDISGQFVVWSGDDGHDFEIFLWDGTKILQLTDNNVDDTEPAIDGVNVVWQAYDGHDYEIYMTTIPEPATLSLLALGGAAALARRRMRSSKFKVQSSR